MTNDKTMMMGLMKLNHNLSNCRVTQHERYYNIAWKYVQ